MAKPQDDKEYPILTALIAKVTQAILSLTNKMYEAAEIAMARAGFTFLHERLEDIVTIQVNSYQRLDGETDDTGRIERAISYLPDGGTILFRGDYVTQKVVFAAKKNITIDAIGTFKRIDNSPYHYTFFHLWGCSGVHIPHPLHLDGNAGNNLQNGVRLHQDMHCFDAFNSDRIDIAAIYEKNTLGDGVALYHSSNVHIGKLWSVSDVVGGRNNLSIIGGDNIYVGSLYGRNVGIPGIGGVMGMPGGIDLEPNNVNDGISNVFVDNIDIETSGDYGFCIMNPNNAPISNIKLRGRIKKIGTLNTSGYIVYASNCSNVDLDVIAEQNNAIDNTCSGAYLGGVTNLKANINISNAKTGVLASNLNGFKVTGKVKTIQSTATMFANCKDGDIQISRISDIGYNGNVGTILSLTSNENLQIKVDAHKESTWFTPNARRVITSYGSNKNVTINSSDLSGYNDVSYDTFLYKGVAEANISEFKFRNCIGYTQNAAKVYNTTSQSIPTGTATVVNFNSESFDGNDMHDTATNTSRIVCKEAGRYLISGGAMFDINGTGFRELTLNVNGTAVQGGDIVTPPVASGYTSLNVAAIVNLKEGDYVTLSVAHNAGVNLGISSQSLSVAMLN